MVATLRWRAAFEFMGDAMPPVNSLTSARACSSSVRARAWCRMRRAALRLWMQRPASERSSPLRPAMRQSSISRSLGGAPASLSAAASVSPTYFSTISRTTQKVCSAFACSAPDDACITCITLWSDACCWRCAPAILSTNSAFPRSASSSGLRLPRRWRGKRIFAAVSGQRSAARVTFNKA